MKDLTKGSEIKTIILFAIPILLGNIFQILYNIVDTRIIGEFLGETYLAAISTTASINNLLIGFIVGMSNGFAILTARFFGAHDKENIKKSIGCIFSLSFINAFFITSFGLLFLEDILKILQTPDELIYISQSYLKIILIGTISTVFYNACSAILRAIGNSIIPLIFLIISTMLNVILDIIFITTFGLGVFGAALATVISQTFSVILCLLVMYTKFKQFLPSKKYFKIDFNMACQLYGNGLSMAMMNCLVNTGSVILQSAINTFGKKIIIAHMAARRLTELFMIVFSSLGTTMATFISQNFGAKNPERMRCGLKNALKIALFAYMLIVLITYTISEQLVYIITASKNPDIIKTAVLYLKINTLFYFITATISIFRNSLQGVGDRKTPIISSSIELIGKISIVYFITPTLKYFGIIIAEPIVWSLMVIPLIIQVFKNKNFKI